MYPHQIERLTSALNAAGGDALVATAAANVAYVTGFRSLAHAVFRGPQFGVFTHRGTALVVPASDVGAAVADGVDVDHVQCFGEPLVSSGEVPGPLVRRVQAIVSHRVPTASEALAAALEALAVREGAIALDEARLPADDRQRIVERLRHHRVVPGSAHLSTARRVKAPFEVECLVGALGIAEEALNEVVQMLKRGVTEREASTLYFSEIVKRGGEPSPSSVTMGDRTALGAVWPSERALRPGELIRLDVGCISRGYVGRVGRNAVLGEPTPAQDAAHGAIQAALEAAVDAAAPGRAASEVYEAAAHARAGPPDFRPRISHGIGSS
jgi:Xaa-Pro aminopeptidase